MADKEDESNMTAEAGEGECSSAAPVHCVAGLEHREDPAVPENTHNANSSSGELTSTVKDTAENSVIQEYFQGSVALAEGAERNIITSFVETPGIETVTTADFSTVNSELVDSSSSATTTIIYVQPDGSFVEGTGLTAEEQRQLVEQLAQQQLVEVTENEAARLFQQPRPPTSNFPHGAALAPSELQQVIDQVSRSQQSAAQVEPPPSQRQEQPPTCITLPAGCVLATGSPVQDATVRPAPLCVVQNASLQLQNVAKQVALQQNQSHNGTRLIQKKLESIRIQVPIPPSSQGATPTLAQPPLALIQQRAPTPKVGVSSPQIIHITPVIGQQQYLLTNPGDPPIQLLLQQRPAPLAVPVLHKVPLQTAPVNGRAPRPCPARGPAPAPPRAPGPPEQKGRERQKSRRPQKVQTRSGRVSRPPKHKVKDYKFIKTEDLADGRQSDSDDYSEISVEEEGAGEGDGAGAGKQGAAGGLGVYLSPRSFQCPRCEKAYIGLGGLARHYRLNPAHREAGPAPAPPTGPGPAQAPPPTDTPPAAQTGHSASTATNQITTNTTQPVPGATTDATAQREKALLPAPGRPKGRGGHPRPAARPARRRKPGRPPKSLGALLPPQRRARLKEVLQVCDDEELMEMVLPRLARVMTLWEFLLVKVEKGHPSRPQFSDVYREFEQLHAQVKKMAQDRFSVPPGPAALPVLDVRDPQVCESLGLGDLVTRLKTAPSETLSAPQQGDPPPKNTGPREECKTLPPAKRFKADLSGTEPNGTFHRQNRTLPPAADAVSSPGSSDPQTPLGSPPPQTHIRAEETGPAPSHTAGAGPGKGAELNGCHMADQMDVVPLDHTYRASSQTEHAQIHLVTQQPGPTEHAQQAASTGPVTLRDAVPQEVSLGDTVQEEVEEVRFGDTVQEEVEAVRFGDTVQEVEAVRFGDTVQEEVQQQVYIQTEEGLILPGGTLASERIVIVTSADGTTMHIRTPDSIPLETVPLETVQALLGIDMGVQPEGVLVSETHP
ncbi:zinc finger protein 839 isoform X2 [Conger conger]|uniref:zinc finger protein 839 isoform X2 n=1 Tax=Conger conger TaxID=82655 RepID=UPI002A59F2B4|nr:zinc finger protein 839 isoform X2 [Conger conger]